MTSGIVIVKTDMIFITSLTKMRESYERNPWLHYSKR
jgi:hypothetical protein